MSNVEETWDEEHDVIVVGSGGGGMFAALFAHKRSLDVLLCEKSSQLGGTTASSGGVMWIPNSAESKAAGVVDSPERALEYLRSEMGAYYRADMAEAYVKTAPIAAAAIQDGTDVKLQVMPTMSDYHASLPGGMAGGRSLEAQRFDGRLLGSDFELVRPPIKQLMLLGGLHVDKRRVDEFLAPFSSVGNFVGVFRTLLRYAMDRTRYSRGTDIGAGNALIARQLLSLRKRNVPIWLNAPMVDLVGDAESRVRGVVLQKDGKSVRVRARKGVVLATGGFPRDAKMIAELARNHPHDQSVAYEGNVGDGIKSARRLGGVVDTDLKTPCFWTPTSKCVEPDGTVSTRLYGYLDRGRPGVIAVNKHGRRFVNESNSYHDIVQGMFEDGVDERSRFHFIFDRRFIWRRGMGMIRPFRLSLRRYIDSGYIVTGRTLRELATRIGVDADTLEKTVERHNGFCKTGVDVDFGKGSDPYNRMFGDPSVKPNPNLSPIAHGPYFALRIFPGTLGTTVGLKTTADAQVVNTQGEPIPGLYACGNEMASAFRGFYPGGGATLGPGLVFAYRAVESMASAMASDPSPSTSASRQAVPQPADQVALNR